MLLLIPKLIDAEVVAALRARLDESESEFADGKSTARGGARDIKENLQLSPITPAGQELGKRVVGALNKNGTFTAATLPKQILLPTFSRYGVGGHYGKHLDIPVMGRPPQQLRTDVSVTVFLSDGEEYEGGELLLHVHGGKRAIKGDRGDVFVYPSTTVHEVRPVTKGERVVAVTWIQSLVADSAKRELLYDLTRSIQGLERKDSGREELITLRGCHYNLLRMWAEA